MRKILPLGAALMLAVSLPALALDQGQGQGQGQGNGKGRAERAQDNPGRGDDRGDRGRDRDRGPQRADRQDRDRDDDRRERRVERSDRAVERQLDRRERAVERAAERELDRRVVRAPVDEVIILRRAPDRGLINGCPPGLAKRNNGCLPPGQERRIARARFADLFGQRDGARYGYDDGYLYRLDAQGSPLGYLPLLGGALAAGRVWPAQYDFQPAPAYYVDYYRLPDRYDYRYADGVVYAVDPQTRAISQVAALLTGQPLSVGQPLPAGYDVYNVPYAYRDQYRDTAEARYRYSDGYVYRVDPTTQLIQAAIQLLA